MGRALNTPLPLAARCTALRQGGRRRGGEGQGVATCMCISVHGFILRKRKRYELSHYDDNNNKNDKSVSKCKYLLGNELPIFIPLNQMQ